jgi:hypothetical protein
VSTMDTVLCVYWQHLRLTLFEAAVVSSREGEELYEPLTPWSIFLREANIRSAGQDSFKCSQRSATEHLEAGLLQ